MGAATTSPMPQIQISVALLELNGKQYDLEVRLGGTVAELKRMARPVLQVPVQFQQLIIGEAVVHDDEPISKYVTDAAKPLLVTFYFSDGGLLAHESLAARCAAIDDLTKVVHGGRRQIIEVFITLSADENEVCRHAAVSALARVAHLADERFLEAIVARLLDSNKLIAVTAVQTLAKAAESGNEEARATLLEFVECIEDQEDMMLQLAIIEACVKLPQAHGRRIVRSLCGIFHSSRNTRVRCAAKHAAAELAKRNRGRSSSRSDAQRCDRACDFEAGQACDFEAEQAAQ